MTRILLLVASVAALAGLAVSPSGAAAAEANSTADFLGPREGWGRCRVSLRNVHPMWGGSDVYLNGSGACVVRVVSGPDEKRFELNLPADEAAAVLKLCADVDVLAAKGPDRTGVPDEARPRIVLSDGGGRSREVSKWANDKVPAFDRVYEALLALRKKTGGVKPAYEGKFQADWKPAAAAPPATGPAAAAAPAWQFLDVPEDESRHARDLNPGIDSRLAGVEVMTKVEPADYKDYQDLKQQGQISREERHGGFVYYAVRRGLHVPFPAGPAGAAAGAYVDVTERYKAREPK